MPINLTMEQKVDLILKITILVLIINLFGLVWWWWLENDVWLKYYYVI